MDIRVTENSSVPDHLLRGLGRSRADPGETGVLTGLIPVRWMLVLSTGLHFRSFRYRSKCLSRNGLQRRVGRARLNAPDSKSDIVARLSGVRIPHSPPLALLTTIESDKCKRMRCLDSISILQFVTFYADLCGVRCCFSYYGGFFLPRGLGTPDYLNGL
jgi:hypothetical protein